MKRPLWILVLLTIFFASAIVAVSILVQDPSTSPLLRMTTEELETYLKSPDNGFFTLQEAALHIKKTTSDFRFARKEWLASPCDSEHLPVMREFLAGHEESIALTRQALEAPKFVMPVLIHYDLFETYHTSIYQLASRLFDIAQIHECDGDIESAAALYLDAFRIGAAMLQGGRINEAGTGIYIQSQAMESLGRLRPQLDAATQRLIVDTASAVFDNTPSFEYFYEHTRAWEDRFTNFGIVDKIRERWSTPHWIEQSRIAQKEHLAQLQEFISTTQAELENRPNSE